MNGTPKRIEAVGPGLRKVLIALLLLYALLGVNSAYLGGITFLEWSTGRLYQNYFYQLMFLAHLGLGLVLIPAAMAFIWGHLRKAWVLPNRRAAQVGYGLVAVGAVILVSGLLLTRLDVADIRLEVRQPGWRGVFYWAHVIAPLAAVWLYVLHRLAGPPIRWRVGVSWATAAAAFLVGMMLLHHQDPREYGRTGPESGLAYFFPSLARTATGDFIPAQALMNDHYCLRCHPDIHSQWLYSAHHLSSFNNPAYLFSVLETRKVVHERDGSVKASRFCAGCHDPVPFFSGAFDQRNFDDPEYDLANDESAQAGISCAVCHSITHINSVKGNADYTIEEPIYYPFAFSENSWLRWMSDQLVKAKPELHKKTFLKPLHKTAEFCGSCHKVHLPEEFNDYKWLRGQNHYDSFLLSGVSGHGVASFYYPPKAEANCNGCHMGPLVSNDFGARKISDGGELEVHDHLFPSANAAVPKLVGAPAENVERHQAFLNGVTRVDIFGLHESGTVDGPLHAPIRPTTPAMEAGRTYLVDVVIRTLKMGHHLTQGTTDSNELWLQMVVADARGVIAQNGGVDPDDGHVDPWSHFVNAYVIDRDGQRIDRRNAQDIFIPLYNHQIPPGAADVVHYKLDVPPDVEGPLTLTARLLYRKFDTIYMTKFQGEKFARNDLPILTMAEDRVVFPVRGGAVPTEASAAAPTPEWQRWNDYGIGLLLKGASGSNKGELRQAAAAFAEVSRLGRPDGPLNLSRVYMKEGRVAEAAQALQVAAGFDPPAPPWTLAWLSGMVNHQLGHLDEAVRNFESLAQMDTEETRARGFDFSKDYRLLIEWGLTLFEQSKREVGVERRGARDERLAQAADRFQEALLLDPENAAAHYNLFLVYTLLGRMEEAEYHRGEHLKYKLDDNARDRAIAMARAHDPAADRAAEAIVIYDLTPMKSGLRAANAGGR